MRFDYGTQLSPNPIKLSIGTLKKPTLNEISTLTFEKFDIYEAFLKMTPERFFSKFKNGGQEYWDSVSDEVKEKMTMYDIIIDDKTVCNTYIEIFNFFFVEQVIFKDGLFILLKQSLEERQEIIADNIRGIIHDKTFSQALEMIQQVCCIYDNEEDTEEVKFKNSIAKELYEKMLKAQKKEKERKKVDINLTLPNIISSVSNIHPSINPVNVWNLTIFQLLDSFTRLQVNTMFTIDCTRLSVWGDEKKTFDAALWYKNHYEKK